MLDNTQPNPTEELKPLEIYAMSDEKAEEIAHLCTPIVSASGQNTLYCMRSFVDYKLYYVILPITLTEFSTRYGKWILGTHIQTAFDCFDESVRKFIKTGVTPAQWDELFAEPDEPDMN